MNGIIVVNKEPNYTSRDVVNVLNKVLNTKKIGHTGTLDPMASGVLVICIGEATKLVDMITAYDKEYIAGVKLGIETDTLDTSGNILTSKVTNLHKGDIATCLIKMIGKYDQEAPKYSAIKINGKKLYEYARENIDIELPKREVEIKSLDIISDIDNNNDETNFVIKTTVSKGTYIRSLIRDIAVSLNTVGVMSSLIRTRQGNFKIEVAYKLDDIKTGHYQMLSIKEVLSDYKQVILDDSNRNKVLNGSSIDNVYSSNKVLFLKDENKEAAIYEAVGDQLKPVRIFNID